SLGRFTTRKLFYGFTDIRSRESDEVDYGVPFVLTDGKVMSEQRAELLLGERFGDYAFWNVGLVETYKPLVQAIMDREETDEDDSKAILRDMEATALRQGGALAPINLEARVTVP